MSSQRTIEALAAITDEGVFERLAMAILREAKPIYRNLVETGVNERGRTIRSPLDAIGFESGADPPHMVAVHHTTTARDRLERKWLYDPAKAAPRKGPEASTLAGDVVKTGIIVAEERERTPNLRATLALTTTGEPDESLVRLVEAEGRNRGIEIDLWSRSRLGHFLDTNPVGQWIRRVYLNIEQELLSTELLHELSKKSLTAHCPPDEPTAWVARELDDALATSLRRDVTFLIGSSGVGKTVACHQRLRAHVENGGFGIVLTHEVVASEVSLDQAIMVSLRSLHPSLSLVSESALSFCSSERWLLVVVEDVNQSGKPNDLVEKLSSWTYRSMSDSRGASTNCRLICPLWPENFASLGDQVRKRIEPRTIIAASFKADEGRDAVLARARVKGIDISLLVAEETSRALGHDPLLIALNEQGTALDPHRTVSDYVEGCVSRAAAGSRQYPAADYREALRALGREMLTRYAIELAWEQVRGWEPLQGTRLKLLRHLAQLGELMRFTGSSGAQHLSFRHDRVRDWILADSAAGMAQAGELMDPLVAEPFYAEVMGTVLAFGGGSIESPEPTGDFESTRALSRIAVDRRSG